MSQLAGFPVQNERTHEEMRYAQIFSSVSNPDGKNTGICNQYQEPDYLFRIERLIRYHFSYAGTTGAFTPDVEDLLILWQLGVLVKGSASETGNLW